MVRIGDFVDFHSGGADTSAGEDTFICAALVTMTTEQWQPGFRQPNGTWVSTTDVEQPKAGTVHLLVFYPAHKEGVSTPLPQAIAHVPQGKAHNSWTERSS